MFERLVVHAMGRPDLLTTFGTMADRVRRRAELDGLVQDWVAGYDAREVVARLDEAEVPASLVYSVRDLFEDPHIQARENILPFPSPLGGLLQMAGIVPKLGLTPGAVGSAGPVAIGAHNEEIYCGRLGLTRDDLDGLRARGVI